MISNIPSDPNEYLLKQNDNFKGKKEKLQKKNIPQ